MTVISNHLDHKKWTPWGYAQNVTHVAEGIDFYSTARHGGYKLSPKRLRQMPPAFRKKGGWYEEDCDWAFVTLIFHTEFMESLSEEKRIQCAKEAKKMIIRHYPDQYEQVYGIELQAGESQKRDEHTFYHAHLNNYVCVAAKACDDDPNSVIVTAVRGGRNPYTYQYASDDQADFKISKEEYRKHREKNESPYIIPEGAIKI